MVVVVVVVIFRAKAWWVLCATEPLTKPNVVLASLFINRRDVGCRAHDYPRIQHPHEHDMRMCLSVRSLCRFVICQADCTFRFYYVSVFQTVRAVCGNFAGDLRSSWGSAFEIDPVF